MNLFFIIFLMIIPLLILILFFLASKKIKWEYLASSSFECGFSSYFFSRFSFSIHFYMVALVFLFLDLELCVLMPFFLENFSTLSLMNNTVIFIIILFFGLILEWICKELDWNL